MNTAHIRLNLNKGTQPAGDEITIAQGDKHGLTITATIYDGTEKATLTGYTAHIVAQLPDRTHYYRETATINGSDVTAVIDETKIGTIPGHTDNAYFTLEATDGTIYSTARFGIDILNDALSDTTAAETYDNEIEALVKDAQSAIDKANEAYATLDVTQIKKTASEAKAQSESAMAEVSTKETIETHQADVDALKSAIAKKADATEIPTVPTTLPNPSALTISENGTQAASYDGTEAVTVDITPAGIGAAATSHTHAMAEITGLQDAIDKASSSGSGATYTAGNGITISTDNVISTPIYDGTGYTLGEKLENSSVGMYSVAEGYKTNASASGAHAEGNQTVSAHFSHAEGDHTYISLGAFDSGAHVEGFKTQAIAGTAVHAEGVDTKAFSNAAHAEGSGTQAFSNAAHAEGVDTIASGSSSHAEGSNTIASADSSHAEGSYTTASGFSSHAEGSNTIASADSSSAGGYYTRAIAKYQTVRGKFNAEDADALFIVGNGTADSSRSNAFAVHSDGDIIPGKIASISTMLYPAGAVIAGTATLDTSGLGGTWSSIGTLTIGTTEVTFYQRTA